MGYIQDNRRINNYITYSNSLSDLIQVFDASHSRFNARNFSAFWSKCKTMPCLDTIKLQTIVGETCRHLGDQDMGPRELSNIVHSWAKLSKKECFVTEAS